MRCNKSTARKTYTIVELGAKVDATDFSGNTPLHYAAWKGSAEAVKVLVELGASVEAQSHVGHLPLNYAGRNPITAKVYKEGRGKKGKHKWARQGSFEVATLKESVRVK